MTGTETASAYHPDTSHRYRPERTLVVVRRGGRAAGPAGFPSDPALDALRTRFANGDIDEIEFESLRSVLQRH